MSHILVPQCVKFDDPSKSLFWHIYNKEWNPKSRQAISSMLFVLVLFLFFFGFNLSLHCHCPLGNLGETLKKEKKKKTISNRLDEYVFISLLIM